MKKTGKFAALSLALMMTFTGCRGNADPGVMGGENAVTESFTDIYGEETDSVNDMKTDEAVVLDVSNVPNVSNGENSKATEETSAENGTDNGDFKDIGESGKFLYGYTEGEDLVPLDLYNYYEVQYAIIMSSEEAYEEMKTYYDDLSYEDYLELLDSELGMEKTDTDKYSGYDLMILLNYYGEEGGSHPAAAKAGFDKFTEMLMAGDFRKYIGKNNILEVSLFHEGDMVSLTVRYYDDNDERQTIVDDMPVSILGEGEDSGAEPLTREFIGDIRIETYPGGDRENSGYIISGCIIKNCGSEPLDSLPRFIGENLIDESFTNILIDYPSHGVHNGISEFYTITEGSVDYDSYEQFLSVLDNAPNDEYVSKHQYRSLEPGDEAYVYLYSPNS